MSSINGDGHHFEATSSSKLGKGGGWKSAIFIICVEVAERFAYYGIAGNLMIYLTTELGEPVATAAKDVNTWNGVLSLALLIGAFFADSYLGRFKTTIISTTIFLQGLILLTLSVSIIPSHHRKAIFFTALYVIAFGDGGHRPCVQTFAADQFDDTTEQDKKIKSSFFNWWYLGIVIGATTATLVVIYVQDRVSWTLGYMILTAVEATALAIFLIGAKNYRRQSPIGSPLTQVAQVVVAAVRKWRVRSGDGGNGNGKTVADDDDHHHGSMESGMEGKRKVEPSTTSQFRCLDKASIADEHDMSSQVINPWRLCTINQVEKVKLIVRLIPIWICCLAYAIILAQVHTFFIKQATTMKRSIGGASKFQIPPATLIAIPGFVILITVPLYDKLFVPTMQKITNHPAGISSLQRIGIGLALSSLTVAIAAVVEGKRIQAASDHHQREVGLQESIVPMNMSVWWLVPQYVVNGLTDLFAYVGMQELFYDQMPDDMRSLGSAFTNAAIGVGALLSSVVISVVQGISLRWGGDEWLVDDLNRARLDSYYWVLAALVLFDFMVYLFVARWFVWKKRVNPEG